MKKNWLWLWLCMFLLPCFLLFLAPIENKKCLNIDINNFFNFYCWLFILYYFIENNNSFLRFSTPSGLEDVSKYPALFASLLASGAWSLEDLKKLAGINFLRVFREVEKVRVQIFLNQVKLFYFLCKITNYLAGARCQIFSSQFMQLNCN